MPKRTAPALAGMAASFALSCTPLALAASPGSDSAYAPLRPVAECMDPGRVRSWTLLMDNNVLVDAGQRNYLISLRGSCPELTVNPFLGFISNNPIGRVCGDVGDRLVPHGSAASGRPHCSIQSVRVVSNDDYNRFLQQRNVRVSNHQAP
jgi:hypothetical protein